MTFNQRFGAGYIFGGSGSGCGSGSEPLHLINILIHILVSKVQMNWKSRLTLFFAHLAKKMLFNSLMLKNFV